MGRRWGAYSERGITEHGPSYQFECHDCGHMSDCYDTIKEMKAARKRHRCHGCPTCGQAVVEVDE